MVANTNVHLKYYEDVKSEPRYTIYNKYDKEPKIFRWVCKLFGEFLKNELSKYQKNVYVAHKVKT
jgi:hypothetical protein